MPEDLKTTFSTWQETQDPDDLEIVVGLLEPRISYHLGRLGLGGDPLAHTQAKIYTAQAVRSYDPTKGAALPTWADRNLVQLQRFNRTRATPVKIPERVQIDHYNLGQETLQFEEEHGREPGLEELSDRAGLSVSRINAVRKTFRKMVGEAPFEGNLASNLETDLHSEALEALWHDSNAQDRKILELTTGFGSDKPPLPRAIDVAARLKLDPIKLSRRKTRLAAKLDELVEMLEDQTR